MTIQAICFLYQMRRVQREENGDVYLVEDGHTFQSVVEDGQPFKSYRSKKSQEQLRPMLDYLKKLNLLDYGGYYLRLTHEGFHYFQTMFAHAIHALFMGAVLPIIVSIITAILTTIITLRLAA